MAFTQISSSNLLGVHDLKIMNELFMGWLERYMSLGMTTIFLKPYQLDPSEYDGEEWISDPEIVDPVVKSWFDTRSPWQEGDSPFEWPRAYMTEERLNAGSPWLPNKSPIRAMQEWAYTVWQLGGYGKLADPSLGPTETPVLQLLGSDVFPNSSGNFNFRRKVELSQDFDYGFLQAGDIFGPWIIQDLQDAFSSFTVFSREAQFYGDYGISAVTVFTERDLYEGCPHSYLYPRDLYDSRYDVNTSSGCNDISGIEEFFDNAVANSTPCEKGASCSSGERAGEGRELFNFKYGYQNGWESKLIKDPPEFWAPVVDILYKHVTRALGSFYLSAAPLSHIIRNQKNWYSWFPYGKNFQDYLATKIPKTGQWMSRNYSVVGINDRTAVNAVDIDIWEAHGSLPRKIITPEEYYSQADIPYPFYDVDELDNVEVFDRRGDTEGPEFFIALKSWGCSELSNLKMPTIPAKGCPLLPSYPDSSTREIDYYWPVRYSGRTEVNLFTFGLIAVHTPAFSN